MPKMNVRRMCCAALLAAMYVPLSLYAAVQFGNVRISFGSLPVVAAALLLDPAPVFGPQGRGCEPKRTFLFRENCPKAGPAA